MVNAATFWSQIASIPPNSGIKMGRSFTRRVRTLLGFTDKTC